VPSLKVTVPVAVEGEIVAVKVTCARKVAGLRDEASVVVVLVFASTETTHTNKIQNQKNTLAEMFLIVVEQSSGRWRSRDCNKTLYATAFVDTSKRKIEDRA
jgi:hypothetical protein